MKPSSPSREAPPPRALSLGRVLIGAGCVLLVLALAEQPALVARLDPVRAATGEAQREILRARIDFAAAGVALGALGALAVTRRGADTLFARRWVARSLLAVLALVLPLFVLERALAPFVDRPTTIFERDAELGWRLKPNAVDVWGGEPVRINAQGLRGPERALAKPAGTRRVLFLGDSVTFGFGIPDEARTLPACAERELALALAAPVECINGGVDGYSTWQEHAFLRRTGLRYEPDVVVLAFVLNDVDERFGLRSFGGSGDGYQLEHTFTAHAPEWIQSSALAAFARQFRGRLAYGPDPREGARRSELLDTFAVLEHPERQDVRDAWSSTLSDVDALVRTCTEHNLPLVLALFPYATQLYRPEFDSPRAILEPFAAARELAFVDVRAAYLHAVRDDAVRIEDLYLDPCHPKALGHELAARAIARVVVERKLLAPR